MAFFQFRKGRDEPPAAPAPAQTVEQMRRRAMHRLIGAALLVLAGVIGFPLLFDNQPRPIPVDLPIVIPDKNKLAPLAVAPAPVKPAVPAVAAASAPTQVPPAPAKTVVVVVPAAAPAAPPPAAAPASSPSVAKAAPLVTPVAPTPTQTAEASKAQALLEGKDPSEKSAASEGRFIVQVGAFAEADKVREVRQKVEASGLKTYTQVVETKEGSRTRVRVGPFADRAEATRAADKIRKLDLPVAILAL